MESSLGKRSLGRIGIFFCCDLVITLFAFFFMVCFLVSTYLCDPIKKHAS